MSEYYGLVHVVVRGAGEDLDEDSLACGLRHRLADVWLSHPASGRVVAVEPATNVLELTGPERERLVWLLERPCPPGREKDLDVAMLRRLGVRR